MLDKERGLYIAHCANGALSITGKMANRHGLIAGGTYAYWIWNSNNILNVNLFSMKEKRKM